MEVEYTVISVVESSLLYCPEPHWFTISILWLKGVFLMDLGWSMVTCWDSGLCNEIRDRSTAVGHLCPCSMHSQFIWKIEVNAVEIHFLQMTKRRKKKKQQHQYLTLSNTETYLKEEKRPFMLWGHRRVNHCCKSVMSLLNLHVLWKKNIQTTKWCSLKLQLVECHISVTLNIH